MDIYNSPPAKKGEKEDDDSMEKRKLEVKLKLEDIKNNQHMLLR